MSLKCPTQGNREATNCSQLTLTSLNPFCVLDMPCRSHDECNCANACMSVVLFLMLLYGAVAQVSIIYKHLQRTQIDSQSTGESSATRGRLGGLVRFAPDRFCSFPHPKNQFHQTAKILKSNDLLMIPLNPSWQNTGHKQGLNISNPTVADFKQTQASQTLNKSLKHEERAITCQSLAQMLMTSIIGSMFISKPISTLGTFKKRIKWQYVKLQQFHQHWDMFDQESSSSNQLGILTLS